MNSNSQVMWVEAVQPRDFKAPSHIGTGAEQKAQQLKVLVSGDQISKERERDKTQGSLSFSSWHKQRFNAALRASTASNSLIASSTSPLSSTHHHICDLTKQSTTSPRPLHDKKRCSWSHKSSTRLGHPIIRQA